MKRLFEADRLDGTYKNPILYADYSDPDVIRVGDTYYMTASSFNYIPGLPILTSRDLVNWKLVNYALKQIPYASYDVPRHSKGVWAPAIRFHEGEFYIYYGMPDEGIFMVKAKDPLGEWDEPVCVLEGKGLIDSCPFWDDDGKAYVIHGYANSRIGFKSCLGIFEMTPDGRRAITEDHIVFNGWEKQPTIEGPKVYKRDNVYYILAPAGGVKPGWQVALRSENIYGPYEDKIVLKQGDSDINGPHQGGLVDTVNGDEWFVHFQDVGICGRITHLQPVTWKDGWPCMGEKIADYCGSPVSIHKKPNTGIDDGAFYLEATDSFKSKELNLMWQWLGNPRKDFYEMTGDGLRLNAVNPSGELNPVLWNCSNVLTQKIVCPSFTIETSIDYSNLKVGEKAGFLVLGGEYAYLAALRTATGFSLVIGVSKGDFYKKEETETVLAVLDGIKPLTVGAVVDEASLKNKGDMFKIFYLNEQNERVFVSDTCSFALSGNSWVGAKTGLFSVGCNEDPGYALVRYFNVDN